jgi:dolichyl-phosphate-mannose--protein O-mannosyl transferase
MPVVVSFVVGFVLAQTTWWFAARSAMSAAALGSESTFRFLMLAGVEILVSAIAFGIAVALASKSRLAAASIKSCFVAFLAGATTSTVAAGPYALVPRIVEGEGQLAIYIVAAILVSAAFGALVGAAFREPASG